MSIVFRPMRVWSLVFCLFFIFADSSAHAQATSGNPTLNRYLSHIDLGLGAIGIFTKGVQGTNYLGEESPAKHRLHRRRAYYGPVHKIALSRL